MPTYSYKCENGHQFDVRQRMTDTPLTECSVCGAAARRVVGSVGVVFKGSGFYITDNRNGANGSSSKKNGTNGSGSEVDSTSSTGAAKNSETAKKPEKEVAKKTEKAGRG